MAKLIIKSQILLSNETGITSIPKSGTTKVAALGYPKMNLSLQYGEEISNLMTVGDRIRQLFKDDGEAMSFYRATDLYSTDLVNAYRSDNTSIIFAFQFIVGDQVINDSAVVGIASPGIFHYQPHTKNSFPFYSGKAGNGFEGFAFLYSKENINITYGKTLHPVAHGILKDIMAVGNTSIGKAVKAMVE